MTIIIQAVMDLPPEHAEAIILEARPLIEDSLAEPGCLAYSWALDPLNPGRLHVFEQWTDEAALAHHFTLPNYTEMRNVLRSRGPIVSKARKFRYDIEEPVYDSEGRARADFFTVQVA